LSKDTGTSTTGLSHPNVSGESMRSLARNITGCFTATRQRTFSKLRNRPTSTTSFDCLRKVSKPKAPAIKRNPQNPAPTSHEVTMTVLQTDAGTGSTAVVPIPSGAVFTTTPVDGSEVAIPVRSPSSGKALQNVSSI